ncbi:MAG: GNAT family N-acetyltransferase [Rhodospirillales bacterium]|nr:GNAT family N-acetyltransferase [Rhodospirillales bacterium]
MITIRATAEADMPAINRIYNQASVRRFTLGLPFVSLGGTMQFFKSGGPRTSLVACGPDGAVLGEASLTRREAARRAHVGSLGLMVAEEARRRGVGRALLNALLDLADNWLNLHRLELDVFANNVAAIPLYEAMGFASEARLRHYAMQDGVLADCHLMARLRPGLAVDDSAPPPRPSPAPRQAFTLRAIEPEDGPALTAMMNLPGVRHGTLATPFLTEESRKHLTEPEAGIQTIAAVAQDKLVGVAVLKPGKGRRLHSAYLSALIVHDEWHGQGIGRALLAAMLETADNWLGLSRVSLAALADNHHAIRLYESFGFEMEGRLRADVFRNGAYVDGVTMARLL